MSESKEDTLDEGKASGREVQIHVKSLVTGESVHFKMPATATVQATWEEAYSELKEESRSGETFRCADGTDLMSRLTETLDQLHEDHICQGNHFEIRGPSGGA